MASWIAWSNLPLGELVVLRPTRLMASWIAQSNSPLGELVASCSSRLNGELGCSIQLATKPVGLDRSFSPSGKLDADCSGVDGEVVVKPEFVTYSIDPEEAAAYWAATCDLQAPQPESWVPNKTRGRGIEGCLSQCNPSFLDVICRFRHVLDSVEFHLPESGECHDSPPDGYFTCYDAHLLRCRLWYPIPEIIVQVLDQFGLSINQFTPTDLQHLVGILILSYERGMTLFDADYLEALLMPVASKKSGIYRLKPRHDMSIIKGFVSNTHGESCIPIIRTKWSRKVLGLDACLPLILPKYDLVFSCSVPLTVAYHRTRLQPDQPVEEESEPFMGEFVPCGLPVVRERSRSPKNKQIAVDDGNNVASDSGTDQADLPEFNPNEFFDYGCVQPSQSSLRASRMCNGSTYMLEASKYFDELIVFIVVDGLFW
ncbi:hypothetical protein N665_0116s0062 [Sinapis alba]|nr:hypothetical protein N665_0116s0062 [Sinapis alba]